MFNKDCAKVSWRRSGRRIGCSRIGDRSFNGFEALFGSNGRKCTSRLHGRTARAAKFDCKAVLVRHYRMSSF